VDGEDEERFCVTYDGPGEKRKDYIFIVARAVYQAGDRASRPRAAPACTSPGPTPRVSRCTPKFHAHLLALRAESACTQRFDDAVARRNAR